MTPSQRLAHRRTLERLRAEVLREGAARIEPNRRDPATTGVADEDAQALSEMMQVLASKRNEGKAALLRQIDRALAKLAAAPEDFGLCESCEEEIPARRLALVPHATLCVACQGRRDPRLGASRKKLTDFR
jgi:DnaK suppressor protein